MTAYEALVKNDGPVGQWRFPVGATEAVDRSGNGHDGTFVGSPTVGQTGPLAGDPLQAIALNGTSQYVDLGNVSAFSFTGLLSCKAWVKFPSNTGQARVIASKMNWTSGVGWALLVNGTSGGTQNAVRFLATTNAAATVLDIESAALSLNAYHLVKVTWDGTTNANGLKLYVDGALVAQATANAGAIGTTSEPARIGFVGNGTGAQYFEGSIGDVALFDIESPAIRAQRYYAFRQYTNELFITVNGVHRGTLKDGNERGVQMDSFNVSDLIDEEPTTCRFRAWDFVVSNGARVQAYYCGAPKLRFSGNVTKTREGYVLSPANMCTDAECDDDTWRLNRTLVNEYYTATSLTDIVLDLAAKYNPSVAVHLVEADLPVIDEITFSNEKFTDCLSRGCRAAGVSWRRGIEDDGLIVGDDPTAEAPTVLDPSHPSLESISVSRRIGDRITRMVVEGGGGNTIADVAPGETILPVTDPSWYPEAGGRVQVGSQRVAYTGVDQGGEGTLIGEGAAPSTGPSAVVADGSGVEDGVHGYAATFVTGSGESLPGPVTNISVGSVTPPSAAPTPGAPTAGSGVTTGDHQYAVTFTNAAGETTPSPLSAVVATGPVTSGLISAPGSAPSVGTPSLGDGPDTGNHKYAVTFINGVGETTAGPDSSTVATDGYENASIGRTAQNFGAGGIAAGSYHWCMTQVTADGETAVASGGSESVGNSFDMRLTFSNSPATGVLSRKIYRTTNGGSTFKLVATILNSDTSGQYIDSTPDGSLGANGPTTNGTYKHVVGLSSIPTGPTGTTGRRIYRTAAGGSQLKLVATIANNSSTTYTDTTPDASLGANIPVSNTTATTTNYNVVPLTGIPIGPANVTSRKLYRTAAGGSQLKLLATLADNSTTTYNDSIADGSLGANVPVSNTADANQVSLSAIPIGPATTTSRKVYRTTAGGSQLKLLTTIGNNSTTTYTDSTADASLGANAPTSDTSGLAQPPGQLLQGSTSARVASWPSSYPQQGWAVIGNGQQVIRYTGVSGGNTLTGIPASGIGAIESTVNYGSSITAAPQLIGISGGSPLTDEGVRFLAPVGTPVNILAVIDDALAQAALGAMLLDENGDPTDGIIEGFRRDGRLSYEGSAQLATAMLELLSTIQPTVEAEVRDPKAMAGVLIAIDQPGFPTPIDDEFRIQNVEVGHFGVTDTSVFPLHRLTASSSLFTVEKLLRQLAASATVHEQ